MTRTRLALVLAGLFALSTSSFVCQRVADRGRFAVPWSSHGAGPAGARGLYLLASELGGHPTRWAEDLARLPAHGGMLVALSDCEQGMARPLSRLEQADLRAWIERGGVLLVAGAHHYVPDDFPITFLPDLRCAEERELFPDQSFPEPESRSAFAVAEPLRGLPPIVLHGAGYLLLRPEAPDTVVLLEQPVLTQESGDASEADVVGAAAKLGRGHVIVLASASPLQNRALLEHDGGALFARLLTHYAPRGPVLFDEYHLGLGERRSPMRYLRQAGATPYVLQLLLIVAVVLIRAGSRFGGVQPVPEPTPPGTASFVAALGALFGRAADPAGTTQILARQALSRIAAHHHLQGLSAPRLADQLRARGRAEAAEAVLAIARTGELLAGAGYDLVEVSHRLDDAVAKACEEPAPVDTRGSARLVPLRCPP